MPINMTRTFYPVGQGAFYSERFHCKDGGDDFCVVYDCGTKTSKGKENAAAIIQDAFKDNTPIDVLFISHFDKDHVSMMGELANHRQIKRVVLPLLPVEETAVLQVYYRQTRNLIGNTLLTDPIKLFGEETVVLHVVSGENEVRELLQYSVESNRDFSPGADVVMLSPNGERVDAEAGQCTKIPSGTMIFMPRYQWCYIPHNYKYPERHQGALGERRKARQGSVAEGNRRR